MSVVNLMLCFNYPYSDGFDSPTFWVERYFVCKTNSIKYLDGSASRKFIYPFLNDFDSIEEEKGDI